MMHTYRKSLSLAFLLSKWCKKNQVQLIAYIVDHGLRDNSAEEAKTVQATLKSLSMYFTFSTC